MSILGPEEDRFLPCVAGNTDLYDLSFLRVPCGWGGVSARAFDSYVAVLLPKTDISSQAEVLKQKERTATA